MPGFLCQPLADLTRQLIYAPAERVRKQMGHIEDLFWELDPDRNYPLEFITYRITRYRVESAPQVMLTGAAAQRDLSRMVEQMSESIGDRAEAYTPLPLTLDEVASELGVSVKTVERYRRRGLFARKLLWPGGRRRLGFLPDTLRRFREVQGERCARAERFTRMDDQTRHAILMRARRIRARTHATPFAVARHLAPKYGRSVESLRRMLVRHDVHDPRVAIFPDHTPPLTERDLKVMHRAYRRGVSVSRIARRFMRSRSAVYRAINLRRAAELQGVTIDYIPNPTFARPDAQQVILDSPLPTGDETRTSTLDARTETALFVRYNFLKHLAQERRSGIDPYHPRPSDLDAAETHLRRAAAVKEQLVRAFLPLVASVARRHMSGSRATALRTLGDLIGEGSLVLLDAIEHFDPARGNRFSTYLTWSLMRRFARVGRSKTPIIMSGLPVEPTIDVHAEAESGTLPVARLLMRLSERERFILTRHFGLALSDDETVSPRTLAQIAAELGISAERARRVERAALVRLRKIAAAMDLSANDLDALTRRTLQ